MYYIITIIIILIIVILIIYVNKTEHFNMTKKERNNAEKYYNQNIKDIINKPFPNTTPKDIVIPLNIFTHWHTKELKPGMLDAVEKLKATNPEFKHYLYDNNDCRLFIEQYFDKDVLTAFDCLIPSAYKADLWRCCVLYIYGGVYLDIKYVPVDGFKLINLMDREHFCLERPGHWENNSYGLYNAIMITKPNNIILKECIDKIVLNVKNKYYGYNPLYPTGPGLLGDIYFNRHNLLLTDIKLVIYFSNNDTITQFIYNNYPILEMYPTYRVEQGYNSNNKSYGQLWSEKAIYGDCF